MKKPKVLFFTSKKNGQFYFRILAKNGEPVASSEGYKSKASRKKGLKALVKTLTAVPITIHVKEGGFDFTQNL